MRWAVPMRRHDRHLSKQAVLCAKRIAVTCSTGLYVITFYFGCQVKYYKILTILLPICDLS